MKSFGEKILNEPFSIPGRVRGLINLEHELLLNYDGGNIHVFRQPLDTTLCVETWVANSEKDEKSINNLPEYSQKIENISKELESLKSVDTSILHQFGKVINDLEAVVKDINIQTSPYFNFVEETTGSLQDIIAKYYTYARDWNSDEKPIGLWSHYDHSLQSLCLVRYYEECTKARTEGYRTGWTFWDIEPENLFERAIDARILYPLHIDKASEHRSRAWYNDSTSWDPSERGK